MKRYPEMRCISNRPPPPCIGVKVHQRIAPTLDAASARTFWALHFRYHSGRPKPVRSSGSKKRQREDSPSDPRLEGGLEGGQRGEHQVDEEEQLCQCKDPVEFSPGVTADAPWGTVGTLRIGIDIPAILQSVCSDASDTSDDEDDYQTVHLSDLMEECENLMEDEARASNLSS